MQARSYVTRELGKQGRQENQGPGSRRDPKSLYRRSCSLHVHVPSPKEKKKRLLKLFHIFLLNSRTKLSESEKMSTSFYTKYVVLLTLVVQMVDNDIHRINLSRVDNAIGFPYTYPVDGDLHVCDGQRYPTFKRPGPELKQLTQNF